MSCNYSTAAAAAATAPAAAATPLSAANSPQKAVTEDLVCKDKKPADLIRKRDI